MNDADIRGFVRRSLGGGAIDVELTDEQINDSIDTAKKWWASHVGQYSRWVQPLGYNEYNVPDDCENVVDVVFPTTGELLSQYYAWADVQISFDKLFGQLQIGGYGDLMQILQYREMGRRIVSSDRDWDYDRMRRKLIITPTPDSADRCIVYYLRNTVDTEYLKIYEANIVRDYALANSMITLGYIRGKYTELPSTTGSFTMNADLLVSNGIDMKDKLEEKIQTLRPPIGFFAG